MTTTVFVNGVTLTDANWMNDVNVATYNVLGDSSTPPTTAVGAMKNLFKQGANIASATTTNLANATGNYVHITGVTTIQAFGTVNAGVPFWLVFDGALLLTYNASSLILPGAVNITTVAGDSGIFVSEGSGNWRCLQYIRAGTGSTVAKQPTRQIFTSGSGTYTTPTGATRIFVRMAGGGGGGAGSGSAPGAAGNGVDTTFSTLTAAKGLAASGVTQGAGGAGTNGDINITGGTGGISSGTANTYGGNGGSNVFGGVGTAGGGPSNTGGSPGVTNTGAGGGGAGCGGTVGSGAGGGAGAYVEKTITTPSATYSYAVGTAGAGGSAGGSGAAGGGGGSGIIIVEESYN